MSKKCAIVVELGSSKIVLRQSLCDAINLYVESGVNEFYISIDQIFGRWALEYIRKKFPKVKCVACTVHYEDANKDYEGITIEDYSGYGRMRLKVIVEQCDCAILITYHTPDSRGTFRSMIGWAQRHVRKMCIRDRHWRAYASSGQNFTRASRQSHFSTSIECWRREIWMQSLAFGSHPSRKSTRSIKRLQRFRWFASVPVSIHWQARAKSV